MLLSLSLREGASQTPRMARRSLTTSTPGMGQDNDSDRSSESERRQSLTPQNFAPRGPVKVRNRFRDKIPSHLRLDLHDLPNIARNINFEDLHSAYEVSRATV
jgi:hypothetical protein